MQQDNSTDVVVLLTVLIVVMCIAFEYETGDPASYL